MNRVWIFRRGGGQPPCRWECSRRLGGAHGCDGWCNRRGRRGCGDGDERGFLLRS